MDKQSYVVLEHIFQVPTSQLRSCSFRSGSRAYDSRLCEQSYTLLMARFGLESEGWVHTIHLELGVASSRETPRRQSTQQSGAFGNYYGFVAHPPAQQGLRADHAIPQPIQPAAGTNTVFSSPYRYTEENPLLANNTSSRMPGVWHQQPDNRDSHYDVYGGYRRFEQSGPAPLPEDNSEDAKVFFKSLVVILVVGTFVWWRWHSG